MTKVNYGVISDIHHDPRIVPVAIDVLKEAGAEKLILNGDIGNQQKTLQDSQNYIAMVIDAVGKSNLETYVQPGSHETLLAFGPVMDYFAGKFSNLIDATKNQKAEEKGHCLIFLPGTDFYCGGEFQIGNAEQLPSGRYIQTEKRLMQFEELSQYVGALQQGIAQGAMQYANMNDLRKLVNDPDRSIVVCHVPRKFDNVNTCIDMAYFAEKSDGSVMPGIAVENMIKQQVGDVPYEIIKEIAEQNGLTLKKENRGNEDLKALYEELGITKAVSGHFHESGHRAHDLSGNPVKENGLVSELFWNSGHLDVGQTGILTVNDGKTSYQNINLQDHLR